MSKLQPPSIPRRESTQAVSGTTIEAEPTKSVSVSPTIPDVSATLDPIASNISGSLVLEDDDENLQNLLNGLIRPDLRTIKEHEEVKPDKSYLELSIFPPAKLNLGSSIEKEQQYFHKMIEVQKDIDHDQFHQKLKHFMIFSVSGKPIYSFHGTDDLIIGYTGLITTIISSLEQSLNEEIKTVDYQGLKIMILNKSPILLVSITKIEYEMILDQNTNGNALLLNQLNVLYEYLLCILSRPVITKLFTNRMNYDLRKSLTTLDFNNLDNLCLKLTYGIDMSDMRGVEVVNGSNGDNGGSEANGSNGGIGDTSGPSVHSSDTNIVDPGPNTSTTDGLVDLSPNTSIPETSFSAVPGVSGFSDLSRPSGLSNPSAPSGFSGFDFYLSSLLNNSRKTIKITNTTRTKLNNTLVNSRDKHQDQDFIFGLLTHQDEVISMMKPKTYTLSYKDIKHLLLLISNNQHNNITEDLWIPICMANFNSNGFLYCYVKQMDLSKYLVVDGKFYDSLNINIILLSTNKNNFFKMQGISNKIIESIIETEPFRNSLHTEISTCHDFVQVPLVHYIYKDKNTNQYISSDIVLDKFNKLKFVYYYTSLCTSKTTTISSLTSDNEDRKLTYLKFDDFVGFMLSDKSYEFYCISRESKLNNLIEDSLRVIKWCKKNHKRLFNNVIQYNF